MAMQHYSGSCQCGAVAYEADVDLESALTCNCSRCRRMGFVLTFTPRDKFELKSGEDNLAEYRFASETIRHLFCKTCGVQSFAFGQMPDGSPVAAVNVNCLDGVNARELKTSAYDGASA